MRFWRGKSESMIFVRRDVPQKLRARMGSRAARQIARPERALGASPRGAPATGEPGRICILDEGEERTTRRAPGWVSQRLALSEFFQLFHAIIIKCAHTGHERFPCRRPDEPRVLDALLGFSSGREPCYCPPRDRYNLRLWGTARWGFLFSLVSFTM